MKKWTKKIGAVLIAASLVVTSGITGGTMKASAKKATVKSIVLNQKKVTLVKGKRMQLEATLKPAKAKAKIKWTTSNKKIATVSKKGVVKAVKVGKATITAKVGKKKATCKVTVQASAPTPKPTEAPVEIKDFSITNDYVAHVTLTKPMALTMNDFSVTAKLEKAGAYKKPLKLAHIVNTKNTDYDLVLDGSRQYIENQFTPLEFVKVTINKLKGIKEKEAMYDGLPAHENQYITLSVGEYFQQNFEISYTKGYSTYSVTELPEGLHAKCTINGVLIYGTPKSVANGSYTTLTATDEFGRKVTQKLCFIIGSSEAIAAKFKDEGHTFLQGNFGYLDTYISGGKAARDYVVTCSDEKYNESIYYDIEGGNIYVGDNIDPGTYTINLSIEDGNKTKCSISTKITVVPSVEVTGVIKRGDGSLIPEDTDISFSLKDTKNQYNIPSFRVTVNEEGKYSAWVIPNMSYAVYVDDGRYLLEPNKYIGNSKTTYDLTIPVYKVTVNTSDGVKTNIGFELINTITGKYSNIRIKSGFIFLEKGTYLLTPDSEYTSAKEFGSATFTVDGNTTITISHKEAPTYKVTLTNDSFEIPEDIIWLCDGQMVGQGNSVSLREGPNYIYADYDSYDHNMYYFYDYEEDAYYIDVEPNNDNVENIYAKYYVGGEVIENQSLANKTVDSNSHKVHTFTPSKSTNYNLVVDVTEGSDLTILVRDDAGDDATLLSAFPCSNGAETVALEADHTYYIYVNNDTDDITNYTISATETPSDDPVQD